MTVIAYRDGVLAMDSRANISGTGYMVEKFHIIHPFPTPSTMAPYTVLTIAGCWSVGFKLQEWYKKGADPATFPDECLNPDDSMFARLIVADASGLKWYEKSPYPSRTTGPYMAFGSGMDFAFGAMHHGGTAIEAVAAAIEHDSGCGGAIAAFDVFRGVRLQ